MSILCQKGGYFILWTFIVVLHGSCYTVLIIAWMLLLKYTCKENAYSTRVSTAQQTLKPKTHQDDDHYNNQ